MASDALAPPQAVIGLYIHIPFCRTRCPYCDFVRQPIEGPVPEAFLSALRAEIERFDGPGQADTLYLGGGTPSLLRPAQVAGVLGAVQGRFDLAEPEITIEANPDDISRDLVSAWRDLGINRVSLGVQSFSDAVLAYLGRRHDAATARRACDIVAERFQNWSMDLIFGPQPDAWRATLKACTAFRPPHVSTYGLTYESGTPFGARAHEAVDDATYLELFWRTEEVLAGHERYEVSNLARTGGGESFESRHNLRYWHNEEYAGFGPGAYSFIDGVRSRNPVVLADYTAQPGRKAESLRLQAREIRVETVIQHLRLRAGLPKAYYEQRFGRGVRTDYGAPLDRLIARRLLEEDGQTFRPTRKGFELNNEIGLALVD